MKITVTNLPWWSWGRTGVRAGSRWPHIKNKFEKEYLPFPFFLAYAASLLQENGFKVNFIDAIAEKMSYGRFLALMRELKPDILVCETSAVTFQHDLDLLKRLKGSASVVVCGPDINITQPSFLKSYEFIDYVIAGEYEFTLLELVKYLKNGMGLDEVRGLIYRNAGKIRVNPPRPLVDLDSLPWPLRQSPVIYKYNDAPGDMPLPSVQMIASRGCPFKCKFCLWPQVMYRSSQYRTRNIIDVVDEMDFLVNQMRFKSVYFDDDTFNISKTRMLALCDEIKKRKLNVPWAIMARPDLMDYETLEEMKSAGLYAVKYGIESADQGLLDNIGKDMDLEKAQDIVKFTKDLGVMVHLTFTFGLPGETQKSIYKTIDFAQELDPHTVQFSIATPFPGTKLYKEMELGGYIISRDMSDYDGNHNSVISMRDVDDTVLERAVRRAYKAWTKRRYVKNPFKKSCYLKLAADIFKRHGFFGAMFKIVRFCAQRVLRFLREKMFFEGYVLNKISRKGIRIGRLILLYERGNIRIYWDGRRLSEGEGFASSFSFRNICQDGAPQVFRKINGQEFIVTKRYNGSAIDEIWRIKIVDEKQIRWNVEIISNNGVAISEGRFMLILSGSYRKWVDCWGEGRFFPPNNYDKVRLRNSESDFIALRGRKRLKGQLPTVLFDFSQNDNQCYPAARNADSALGARVLEAGILNSNGNGGENQGLHRVFSGIIKIVEEDFGRKTRISRRECL